MTRISPSICEEQFSGPMAWAAETLLENDGLTTLSPECLSELQDVERLLAANPLPVEALSPDFFEMPACRAMMKGVKAELDQGIGFTILDRLPLDSLDPDCHNKLYWLLMSMVGVTVAQKWDGMMVYDVTDTGAKPTAGSGVRSSKTNAGQGYHTDNAFNLAPDYVALFCIRPAMEGGESGLVSFETVHNRLLEKHPEVLPRLYEPFWFDRQHEHAPDDAPASQMPVFEYDGGVIKVNHATWIIRNGYKVKGLAMDPETAQALDALDDVMEAPGLGKRFMFERGQIQIVNNRRLGHRRTGFTDWPEVAQRRRLVRIWVRNSGRPFYHG
jgi:alpha-ketoglutarate-dependent taurine dioxygenase